MAAGSVGDELDCCWDVSRFDPDFPVQAKPRDWRHSGSGHPRSIPLLASMCAYEPVVMHAVRGGACVPSGEDRGQIRIVVSEAEQHGAPGDTFGR